MAMFLNNIGIFVGSVSQELLAASDFRKYQFCKISLTSSLEPNAICGRVIITPKISSEQEDRRVKIGWDRLPLNYYALTLELTATLTRRSGINRIITNLLVATSDFPTVLKSPVYTVITGDEAGLDPGDLGFEPREKLGFAPTTLPFTLKLPQDIPLPPTLLHPSYQVEYFLTCYIRTPDGYEKLEKKPFNFYGHRILETQDSYINELEETVDLEEFQVKVQVPKKAYVRKDFVNFCVKLEKTCDKFQSIMGTCTVSLVKQIKVVLPNQEETMEKDILDQVIFKKSKVQRSMGSQGLTGKLKFLTGMNQVKPIVFPTYKFQAVFGIQYFLECTLEWTNPQGEVVKSHVPPIEVSQVGTSVTGDDSQSPEQQFGLGVSGLFSRMRAGSVSSLLSLPSYSQVGGGQGGRRASTASFETLPPHYDDVDK